MKKVNPFYKTAAWLKCREVALIRDNYLCQPCFKDGRLVSAEIVHHIKELERYPELGLTLDNLESVCASCHNKLHPEKGKGNRPEPKKRKATVIEVKANIERW
ncbi:HNH endonuclease signature motif containing protein [Paenibacillus chitinolyticus]|uniref:HNH endonuclease n=1 Tax=Paenibacillus chitinolyticus TaxID=79263 RepID=UPI002DBC02D3|nr:HNH endonuclease signature motif containing protein [Paenibacillus chitinolyticus]MEC0248899.1 HNH endonuclease signature motif containing protein [Paenibacillus chitinolyticus]